MEEELGVTGHGLGGERGRSGMGHQGRGGVSEGVTCPMGGHGTADTRRGHGRPHSSGNMIKNDEIVMVSVYYRC